MKHAGAQRGRQSQRSNKVLEHQPAAYDVPVMGRRSEGKSNTERVRDAGEPAHLESHPALDGMPGIPDLRACRVCAPYTCGERLDVEFARRVQR